MTDLLVFYPQGSHLYIEFLVTKYIEQQPKNDDEMVEFMVKIRPIVKQLDEYVLKHGLKEIVELNMKGVPISKLRQDTALTLLQLVIDMRPDLGILEKIRITNSNPVFNMIYKGLKGRMPRRVSSLIEIAADSKFF